MNFLKEITLKDFLQEKSMTLQELAGELGLSISLLSKIKNGIEPISKNTSDVFHKHYKNYKLIGGKEKWKILFINEKKKNLELKAENDRLKDNLKFYRHKFKQIKELATNKNDVYSIRKFDVKGVK